jgi:hypothetical protein
MLVLWRTAVLKNICIEIVAKTDNPLSNATYDKRD